MSAPHSGGATPAGGPNAQISPQTLNSIVIDYLSKKGYTKTEAMLRIESANIDQTGRPVVKRVEDSGAEQYGKAFALLQDWIENNLDIYKVELRRTLWPIFVYSYLTLIIDDKEAQAKRFRESFQSTFADTHESDLRVLSSISLPEHATSNEIAQLYLNNRYRITMTPQAYYLLCSFLESKDIEGGTVILTLFQKYCNIREVARGAAGGSASLLAASLASRDDDLPAEDEGIPGHNPGSANTRPDAPATLPRLGLTARRLDQDLMEDIKADLQSEDTKHPPAPGQESLSALFETRIKEEDADDVERVEIPFPPYKGREIAMEVAKVREHRDRFKIETKTGGVGVGVSVCMFTFHNTAYKINCMDFSDDNLFVAVGCSDSCVMVWSLEGKPLDSVVEPPAGSPPATSMRRLIGHSGPVYGVSFSPSIARSEKAEENTPDLKPVYLLSSSADKTVRLWSLDTWSCLVAYKGHDDVIWDVQWGPFGHYFVTGSHDKTARLWSVDQISYLRMFVGHDQDVDVVAFHPNSAYVFTGSSDKMVRMWAVQTGHPVRMYTGHMGAVTALACSPDGKTLASAGDDGLIILHDLASGNRIKVMRGHGKGGIWSLSWSAESNVIVSGGADGTVRVWDVQKSADAAKTLDAPKANEATAGPSSATAASTAAAATAGASQASASQPGVPGVSAAGGQKKKGKEITVTPDQIGAFPTKKSAVYYVKFTRMNLAVAGGAFLP